MLINDNPLCSPSFIHPNIQTPSGPNEWNSMLFIWSQSDFLLHVKSLQVNDRHMWRPGEKPFSLCMSSVPLSMTCCSDELTLSFTMPYSGNFWGRELSRISRFCGYLQKFSLWNLEVWCHERAICKSLLPQKFLAISMHLRIAYERRL